MNQKNFGRQTGTALLEMALILPVLLMLLLGIIEFSRVLTIKQALTNSVREGARAGAVDLNDLQALATAQSVCQTYLSATGINIGSATVTPQFIVTGGSPALQLTVDYQYDNILTSWIPGVPPSLTLRSTSIMRRES